jgi:hypothetical protein
MSARTFQERLSSASAAIAHGTIALVRAMVPIVLFFFVAFFLIFLIFKLIAAPYTVEFSAFGKAAIAALIVGRIALVLDWAQGSRLAKQPRAVVIACWTFVYALAVVVFLIGGKIFQGAREAGSLQGGINFEIANASLDRALGLVVLIAVVVGLYLVMQEISRAMGKGTLLRLFFERPAGDDNRVLATKQPDETPHQYGDGA